MKKNFFGTLLVFSLTSSSFALPPQSPEVIYGEDNRVEANESPDALLREASRSVAAYISRDYLHKNGNSYTLSGRTLRDRGICETERFSDQTSLASCSGFLVAPNVLVTAGHCVKSTTGCDKGVWVFDYKVTKAQEAIKVPESSVFTCKRIIRKVLDPMLRRDFAVIELDSVVNRRPLKLRESGQVSVGDQLAVIGYPSGLPLKIADNGEVRRLDKHFFVTNLDTYHGNSGSPVLNAKTGIVEGILVRGDDDFVKSPEGCQVSKTCSSTGCRGEDVSYITDVKAD